MKKLFIFLVFLFSFINTSFSQDKNMLDIKIMSNSWFIDSSIWFWLSHSFEAMFFYDKSDWSLEFILPNWKSWEFFIWYDLNYISNDKNNIELETKDDFAFLKDLDINTIYVFSLENNRLEKIILDNYELQKTIYIFYDNFWKINFVSDFETNSLFFFYEDGLLKNINLVNWWDIDFKYTYINSKKYLSSINYDNQRFEIFYDEDNNAFLEENRQDNLSLITKNYIDYSFIYSKKSDWNIILNNKTDHIKYLSLNNELYSVFWDSFYKIDLKNNSRKLIFKNDKKINSIFIINDSYFYIIDDSFLKKISNWVKENISLDFSDYPLLSTKDISSFVIISGDMFFVNKYMSGYFKYSFKDHTLTLFDSDNLYKALFLDWDNLAFVSLGDRNIIPKSPEFKAKYKYKLDNLKNYLEKNHISLTKKQKILEILETKKIEIEWSLYTNYKKEELYFLILDLIKLIKWQD